MNRERRKAAIALCKERPSAHGVFAVICRATGEAWVGTSPNIEKVRNGLWFSLRSGRSHFRSLQRAWNQHGEDEIRYEELDRLRPDFPDGLRTRELKTRAALWRARLQAEALF